MDKIATHPPFPLRLCLTCHTFPKRLVPRTEHQDGRSILLNVVGLFPRFLTVDSPPHNVGRVYPTSTPRMTQQQLQKCNWTTICFALQHSPLTGPGGGTNSLSRKGKQSEDADPSHILMQTNNRGSKMLRDASRGYRDVLHLPVPNKDFSHGLGNDPRYYHLHQHQR